MFTVAQSLRPVLPACLRPRSTPARLTLALALALPVAARADFTLAFRFGVTTYPGTSTPITGDFKDAFLHNNGVVFATRTAIGTTLRHSLLHHRAGALNVILNETGGFPGGGDILNLSLASDGTSTFATVNRASGAGTSDRSALVRLDSGSSVAVIPNSATIIPGTPATTGFTSPSSAGGRVAFVGTAAGFSQYLYRAVGTSATLIAQENVTLQPGGPGRFNAFLNPVASPDGTRIFFTGLNSAATTSPDYRRGLYVEQGGIITRVLDNTTDVPGATVKFDPTAAPPALFLSANGAHVVVRAGSKRAELATGPDRFGLYRYSSSGVLTRVADNTTSAGGDTLVEPSVFGAAVANDGTVFFLGIGAQRQNLYRADLNGTVSLVLRNSADFQGMSNLWLYGTNVYVIGTNAAFERVLLRIPVEGGTPAVALNLTTHPAFASLNANGLTRFEIAGNLALVQISAFNAGANTAAILYAPASDVDGTSTSGGSGGSGSGGSGGGSGGGGAAPITSRLSNLAVRTTLAANQLLTVGFTMSGGGAKDVLVRAAGPGLGALGVPGTMADPKLALFNGSTQVAANDNWAGNTAVSSAIAAVGAFPFASTTSLDAALVASVDGGRTVQVSGPAAGNLIVEAYDAGTGNSPRLTNLSALNRVGTGADVLIAGFTLTGTGNKNVLIRAVGPSLAAAPFNLGGTLADPKLELYNSAQAKIGENDTWASTLGTTFSSVGAFGLVAGSKDAAVIVNLPPGGYTVQVSGADGGTGLAIIELYELP